MSENWHARGHRRVRGRRARHAAGRPVGQAARDEYFTFHLEEWTCDTN